MILRGCVVLLAAIRAPATLPYAGRVYGIEVRLADGSERLYVARAQPELSRVGGDPLMLAAELAPGSVVNLDVDGPALRAVQVVELKIVDRFA